MNALATVPGQSAIVLDVLARTEGMPVAIIAGTETNEPPPARAFIVPEQKPAANRKARAANVAGCSSI